MTNESEKESKVFAFGSFAVYTVCYKDEAAALTDSDGAVSDAEENDVSVTTGDIIRYNSVVGLTTEL